MEIKKILKINPMNLFKKKHHYSLEGIYKGHHLVTYKGVLSIKCPFDYTIYQMILWQVKPDLIIEIGTNKGGTTLYLADLLSLNNKGEIHTIDLPTNEEDISLHHHPRIKIFKDGFLNYDTSILYAFNNILIIEDGSHQYEDTLAALKMFSTYVSKGSYFLVEDGIVTALGRNKEFNGGPKRAVHEFLKEDNSFFI